MATTLVGVAYGRRCGREAPQDALNLSRFWAKKLPVLVTGVFDPARFFFVRRLTLDLVLNQTVEMMPETVSCTAVHLR